MGGEGDARRGPDPGGGEPGVRGPLWLHAVVRRPLAGRARRWLGSREEEHGDAAEGTSATGLDGTLRVDHGDLSAVVSPAAPAGDAPETAAARLDRHARIVEALADSDTVVPAPPGLRAEGEPAVRAFLERARLALEEALDLFDGAREMRLHVRRVDEAVAPAVADGLYRRLRRQARAARRLSPEGDDLLTAAFLVPVAGWREGREIAARWREDRPDLEVELTGPWPPYDFVRMFTLDAAGPSGDRAGGGTDVDVEEGAVDAEGGTET